MKQADDEDKSIEKAPPFMKPPIWLGRIDRLLAVLIIIYLCASSILLQRFPKVWTDTCWTMIESVTLVEEGRFVNPMMPRQGLDKHFLAPQIVPRLALAGVYSVWGVGLFQSRALSVLAGLGIVIATYLFTRRYFGRGTAFIAGFLLIFDNIFFLVSRSVRDDIFVALFSVCGFFLFVYAVKEASRWSFALSGALMGISLYTHPNSAVVLFTIFLLFLIRDRLRFIFSVDFWIFIVSCLVLFSPYVIYVIYSDASNGFNDFIAQLGPNIAYSSRSVALDFLSGFVRVVRYIHFPFRIYIFIFQIFSLIFFWKNHKIVNRFLVIFVICFSLILPFWNPSNTTPRYFIIITPVLSIIVAEFIMSLYRKRSGFGKFSGKLHFDSRVLAVFLGGAFFLNQFLGDVTILWRHRDNDYHKFVSEIRNVVPRGSRVWGSVAFWLGMRDYPYRSQLTPLADIIEFRPEYVILYDSEIWGNKSVIVGTPLEPPEGWKVTREAMEGLCGASGRRVAIIEDRFYGDIEIYRVQWDD
ncbi:ArnT family glycosyltransferase [Acidobacteriota bacterium]